MNFETVTNRGAAPALIATATFMEARLRTVAENVANMHTPGYQARQLDDVGFRQALRRALDARDGNPKAPLVVKSGREVATRADGTLMIRPSETPVQNAMFHDGTNLSLERQMADLAETGMAHDLAVGLLTGHFDGLRKAIRGTVA